MHHNSKQSLFNSGILTVIKDLIVVITSTCSSTQCFHYVSENLFTDKILLVSILNG